MLKLFVLNRVSLFADIEHENDFQGLRVKLNPLDILPKGDRSFATTSQPNRGKNNFIIGNASY